MAGDKVNRIAIGAQASESLFGVFGLLSCSHLLFLSDPRDRLQ